VDFIAAKDHGGGGDNWSCETYKAPVKASPPTNQTPSSLQARCPACRKTNSVEALNGRMDSLDCWSRILYRSNTLPVKAVKTVTDAM